MRLVYAALLLMAAALAATTATLWLRFDPLSTPPVEANSTVTVPVGDAWFCDETFAGGVCDTVIAVGDTISWDFGGAGLPHTTTACGADCDAPTATPLWDSGVIAGGGGTFEFTFTEPGSYLYYCEVHPFSQRGQIIVEGAQPPATDLWQVVPPGVEVERFASDLSLPVNLATAPDPGNDPDTPFLYVAELYGQVRVLTKNGTVSTYEDGLLNFDPSAEPFPGAGSSGVSGITVEPDSGDLFVSLVYADELDSGAPKNRVLRLESSPDGMTSVGQQTVIEGIPAGLDHQAHALTIGPGGKLYVNLSDGFEPSAALDDNDLRGKILRLNLDGSIPVDNPDPASAVYAKGFRNPFGAAWHPEEPWLYVSDNGVVTGDRIIRVAPGESYGWDGTEASLEPSALYLFDRVDAVSPTAIAFDRDHLLSPEGETHLFVAITGPWLVTGPAA
ncbi:MAG: PQQ-dependent sugar dehydrogenase, partial [Chloroflexi bacterium]|nr:PQQ-dependent sugar dehydrogenase [Chloroflexota bacterium]